MGKTGEWNVEEQVPFRVENKSHSLTFLCISSKMVEERITEKGESARRLRGNTFDSDPGT